MSLNPMTDHQPVMDSQKSFVNESLEQLPPPCILVVEDDQNARLFIVSGLKNEGYVVVDAQDGEKGVERFQQVSPDLILMDALMPGMTGFESCSRIRSLPGGSKVPIVMITALEDEESVNRAFTSGATDYIKKPIQWALLRHRIRCLVWAGRAEAALRASEARYRAIVEDQTELVCRFTPDFVLTFVNDAYCRYFNQDCRNLIGHSFFPLIFPDDHDRARRHLASVNRDLQQSTLEHRVIRPDGTVGWQQWYNRAIFNDQGELVEFQSVGRDITDQREVEATLRQQQKDQQVIFDSVPAMIWYKDTHNKILRANKSAAEYTGLTVKEIEGQDTAALYPDEAAQYYQDDLEVISTGQAKFGIIETMQTGSGEKIWVQTDKIPYRDEEGTIVGVIVFAHDITELKRTDDALKHANLELQQLNQLKSKFLSIVSHDLRSPLSTIISMIDIMLAGYQGDLNQIQKNSMEVMNRSTERMLRLINDLLDMSRIEAGLMKLHVETANFQMLITQAIEETKPVASKRHIEISVELPAENVQAAVDPDRILQVIVNLVSNAVRFARHMVQIRLWVEDSCLLVNVLDDGSGIPEGELEHIFDRFVQARTYVWRSGAGLGLSIVREIVESHGGRVWAENRVSGEDAKVCGASFTFSIPIEPNGVAS